MEIKKFVISGEEDFEKLLDKWKRLSAGKDMTFFQSYEWNLLLYRNWKKSLYNRIFSKVVIYEAENIIVPFIVQRLNISFKWIGRSEGVYFLGTGSYSDYMNFIYSDINGLEELMDYVKKDNKGLKLKLNFICRGSESLRYMSNGILKETEVCVGVKTESTIEEYDQKLSKHTRQNLRTALNRMEKDGIKYEYEIKLGILEGSLIEELACIHLARVINKNRMGQGGFKSRVSSFLRLKHLRREELRRNIIKEAMQSIENSLTLIVRLDDKIVGYIYGFIENNSIVRICQNCFDENYKFYSPVFRACYDFICECCKNNDYCEIDFTRGNEEYKYKLAGTEREIYSYEV